MYSLSETSLGVLLLNSDIDHYVIIRKLLDLIFACFHAGFLLGLFFYPEDGSDMFLQNVA
jgi:hypothetical protein